MPLPADESFGRCVSLAWIGDTHTALAGRARQDRAHFSPRYGYMYFAGRYRLNVCMLLGRCVVEQVPAQLEIYNRLKFAVNLPSHM